MLRNCHSVESASSGGEVRDGACRESVRFVCNDISPRPPRCEDTEPASDYTDRMLRAVFFRAAVWSPETARPDVKLP